MKSLASEKVAYLAGLLDGEGTICILRGSHKETKERVWFESYTLRLSITNTNLALLEWVRQHFGGSIQERKEVTVRWNKTWIWYCGGKNASDIIRKCLLFLVAKKEQAKIALTFRETFKGKRTAYRIPPNILEERAEAYQLIKNLNGRSGYCVQDSKDLPRRMKAFL
jgi:hypothetical protein